MDHVRIAELLAPFLGKDEDQQLTADELGRISTYIDILLLWNARINLTAIRNPEEIVTRHFGESFFAARMLFPDRDHVRTAPAPRERPILARRDAAARNREEHGFSRPDRSRQLEGAFAPPVTLADIGSGAGFPGIPIKLWQPCIALTLIESNQKKSTFLREVARALTLTDINIFAARAESLTAASFETVTLRAVEHFASVLPTAARLVAPAGRLALLIGSSQMPQTQAVLEKITGFDVQALRAYPIPNSKSRVMLIAKR
jgi:16S rRNA (guanine527-N7)-methyltransferase